MARRKNAPEARKPALLEGSELREGEELDEGDELDEGEELRAFSRFAGATALRRTASMATSPLPFSGVTGADVLSLARLHIGEKYVLGARAPMSNADWTGPWDCAEFVSWCVYQKGKILFGTEPRTDPMLADAYTGFWLQQARSTEGSLIDLRDAAGIPGAAVLRRPMSGQIGHIVLSDGRGGTIEAHSRLRGVIAGTLSDRRWDCGILVPGIRYTRSDEPVDLKPVMEGTLRLTTPLMEGDRVRHLQQRLRELGLMVGEADGIFGPQTAHAVGIFQMRSGLVSDGEVGSQTRAALGLPSD
ncbi:peptidoglycan-binding domain-containing protein [Variovorax sp. LjRoot290]|uniref:peptidoglycan-binding domain-containing protein n=1 Tax=Variovorax sp. LjRoot290 TaxID=3342316 RepID=UPI003ECEFF20